MTMESALKEAIRVPVELGDRSYGVWVGPGVRHCLSQVIPSDVKRVAVVTQAAVADAGITVDPGVDHRVFITDDGEHIKSLGAVEELCREFAQWGLTRRDAVVAVGGGAVTDLAGFTAAVYHRGIRVVFVVHHPAGPDRRLSRRQDRREPARGQESGRRILAALRGAV